MNLRHVRANPSSQPHAPIHGGTGFSISVPAKKSPVDAAKACQYSFLRAVPNGEWIGTLIFFAAYFSIVLWGINPVLHYYAFGPAFLETSEFFSKFTTYPGGLIEYLASYGELWFQYAPCGAFISTLVAWLVCEATRHYLNAVRGGVSPYPWSLAPAFFLIAMQSWLEYPWLDTALVFFVCVAALAIYCRLPLKNAAFRLCAFTILLAAVYGLSGAMVLILAAGAAVYESGSRKRHLLGGLTLLLGAITPWLATFYYVLHIQDAYLFKLVWNRAHPGLLISPWLLYSSLPASALVMAWIRHREATAPALTKTQDPKSQTKKQSRRSGFASKFGISLIQAIRHPATPVLLFALSALLWFNGTTKKLGQINVCSRERNWSGVLDAARNLHGWPSYAVADINRALCQQGRLLDTMFAYPQRADFALWLHFHNTMEDAKTMISSDILFDLGQVNKAERMAVESLELNGYRSATLWRLFYVYVLKNEPDTARIYLNMLDLCPAEKSRAARVRIEFERDSTLAGDEELTRIRSVMIKEDYLGSHNASDILAQSLHRNPANFMAVQYLMAHFLLNQDLEYIEKNLRLFARLKLPQLPRHIQEAILLQQKLAKDHSVQLGPWKIAPETMRAFETFNQRFMSFGGNLEAAREDLRADYGDTYWFFYMFEVSGSALKTK
jgi:hypothetical protein